jgi:hypothetical protein
MYMSFLCNRKNRFWLYKMGEQRGAIINQLLSESVALIRQIV